MVLSLFGLEILSRCAVTFPRTKLAKAVVVCKEWQLISRKNAIVF